MSVIFDKTKSVRYLIPLIYVWIGFVGAISFMEAWLKFQAEGVTRAIGLSIGRLVFFVLNKVEITFLLLIFILIISLGKTNTKRHIYLALILIIILAIQTFYLLPILDERANLFIQNKFINSSYIHLVYIFLEVIKIVTLFVLGGHFLKKQYIYNIKKA